MPKVPVVFILALLCLAWTDLLAQDESAVVIFKEDGFPAADSAAPTDQQITALFPNSKLAGADQLSKELAQPSARVLLLPYGSAFPEDAWPGIKQFLDRGGNLIALGGKPFTRAAYRDEHGWHLRDYSVRFIRPLMIDQYQETPGSAGLQFETNPELTLQLPRFNWKQAFSPVIRLSAVDLYHRGGSAGAIDARLDTLAWGTKDGRKLSAPVIQVDHYRNGFDGARWILVNAELQSDFFENTKLVQSLVQRALQGAEEFTAKPVLPLYLSGEPIQLQVVWNAARSGTNSLSLRISSFPEADPSNRSTVNGPLTTSPRVEIPGPSGKGLYVIEAQVMEGDRVRAIYHSGFWIRDEEFLRSGPHLSINRDFFELDGYPLAVIGTTYMSSEVQRLFFEHPNVFVWNQDLKQIHDADRMGQVLRRKWSALRAHIANARGLLDDGTQIWAAGAV
jgi:hypothetical protein